MKALFTTCSLLMIVSCQAPSPSTVVRHADVASAHVAARNVDVYLPEGYDPSGSTRYPVLYMHDGQNLFSTETAYGGVEWRIDEVMDSLKLKAIVVGVWNSPKRFHEYAPQEPLVSEISPDGLEAVRIRLTEEPMSDAYLRFLVTELKPFIDSTYATKTDRDNTFIMGSSMGGLISLYAITEYPDVFGGAACVSTHWPLLIDRNTPYFMDAYLAYLDRTLPKVDAPKLYFDHGTENLDANYAVHQIRMDSLMRAKAWPEDRWMTRVFDGEDHNERSWQKRVHIPLQFLLGD
jgi:enterochelin esterase-like enzyme